MTKIPTASDRVRGVDAEGLRRLWSAVSRLGSDASFERDNRKVAATCRPDATSEQFHAFGGVR
jgi:hypothetical protein